jgi:hypothetical protein
MKPVQTPALKIPPITSQEASDIISASKGRRLYFFIVLLFLHHPAQEDHSHKNEQEKIHATPLLLQSMQ